MRNYRRPEPESGLQPTWYGAPITRRLFDANGEQLTIDRNVTSSVQLKKFKGIKGALEWKMWDLVRRKGNQKTSTSRLQYSFQIRLKNGLRVGPLDEEWFLCNDRAIRKGCTSWLLGTAFIGEVRPPTQKP